MTTEYLLQFAGTLAIDTDLTTEVILSLVGCLQHGCHRILGTVTRSRRQRIEHTRREYGTKGQPLITLGKGVEMTMEQRIGDADHANTLASIAECLRAADKQHIIIGIAGNGGLIRRLERLREILAEVHSEVS